MSLIKTKTYNLGTIIAELRKAKGWTQNELAEKLRVSDKAVSKWEKDHGVPSIEFLPMLADLFGVSIDYLLTGKQSHKEIVFISKEEYCAQKDDIRFLEDIFNDEKCSVASLCKYAIQYKSLNVISALADADKGYFWSDCYNYKENDQFSQSAAIDKLKNYDLGAIVTPRFYEVILLLMKVNKERKVWGDDKRVLGYQTSLLLMGADEQIVNYLVDNYDKLPKDQKEYYFGTDEGISQNRNGWVKGYPHLLDRAYKNGNIKLVEFLLAQMELIKTHYLERAKELRAHGARPCTSNRAYYEDRRLSFYLGCASVKPLRQTVETAYAKHDKIWGERLNELLDKPLNEYEIKVIWVDNDKSKTEVEKLIEKAFHGELLYINDLLKIDDFDTVKKLLLKSPVHKIEIINEMFNKKQWDKLLNYYTPNNTNLKTLIDKKDWTALEYYIVKNSWNNDNLRNPIGGENVENWQYLCPHYNSNYNYHTHKDCNTLNECIDYINECKQKVLINTQQEITKRKLRTQLEEEKEKTNYLTKEYFMNELAHGNIDLVIVKLCVKLEAILKYDYSLEGEFADMIATHCSSSHYSAQNYKYENIYSVLDKLRRNRNNIVHSTSDDTVINADEIMLCIEYICQLGNNKL